MQVDVEPCHLAYMNRPEGMDIFTTTHIYNYYALNIVSSQASREELTTSCRSNYACWRHPEEGSKQWRGLSNPPHSLLVQLNETHLAVHYRAHASFRMVQNRWFPAPRSQHHHCAQRFAGCKPCSAGRL